MKKLILTAAAATLALGALTGCSSQSGNMTPTANEVDEYIGVCMDNATQNRVDDRNCDPNMNSTQYSPYFYSYGSMIPGLGYHVIGGYPTVYAPYNMGFGTTGGSSANYQPRTPLAYPKGYVAPPNAVYKQATPSMTPPKTASEAAAKYSAPKSNTSTSSNSGSSTSSNSGSSTSSVTKSNPYSYTGKTSSKK
jgi:hypothetical protein